MAKKKMKKNRTRKSKDGLRIIDERFGVNADAHALHEEFSEQAEVAEILYQARNEAGLTQKQLAEIVGTTQQVVSQLEDADYKGHSLSMLRRIAAALNSRVEIRLVPNSRESVAV